MTTRVCFLSFVLTFGGPSAPGQDVVFRSDVSIVRVDAQVVERGGRAVTGLGAADFVLLEEGKQQKIRNFASENMPVDVLVLLDVSASMRPHVQRVADAAHQALRVLGDQDRVGIMVFDRSTRLRLPFRNSRSDVQREFERLLNEETFHSGTDITRGLLDAASYVAREGRREARRAIVILTDDQTEFRRDEEAVSRALIRADAVLCALLAPDAMRYSQGGAGIPQTGGSWPGGTSTGGPLGGIILGRRRPPYGGPGQTTRGPRTKSAGTAEIARQSGGDSMGVDDVYALENTLARIRQRYALYFYLPPGVKAGQERSIEVELADAARGRYPNGEIRYRRVYLAPGDSERSAAEPTVITRSPTNHSGGRNESPIPDESPQMRRRPAVSDTSVSRDGPLDLGANSASGSVQSQSPATQDVWRRADEPPKNPASKDQKPSEPAAVQGGWRRATPEDKGATSKLLRSSS